MSKTSMASGGIGRPIAVLGANGQVGRAVVSALRVRGAACRRILRRPLQPSIAGDTVVADWSEAMLKRAFDGCSGAFLMVPLVEQAPELGRACHAAAAAAELDRVVRLSVLQQLAHDGLALGRLHRDLDDDLHSYDLQAASLCPDSFMQNLLPMAPAVRSGQLPNATEAGRMAFVDVADIAACAAAMLCGDAPCAGRHDLTGPEQLSMPDVATLLGDLLASPVQCVTQSVEALRQQLLDFGMPKFLVEMLCELTQWTRDGRAQTPTDSIDAITGRSPKSMEQFLAENRAAF
ncbi:NmrA family NAD(P)-binding protein [bacterium]|nr:NmrA family NAD(P)-binding protein [bacterium]